GGDHLDVRIEGVVGELEAHLVVTLAGGAVRHGVGTGLGGDLDLPLGDERPRDRGAQQILTLIEGVGAEHREDEVAHELLAQVLDEDLLDAEHLCLPARRLELLALAEVGGEGDDLAAVGLLQPLQDDGGVEAARIGEHDLLDAAGHGKSLGYGRFGCTAAEYRHRPFGRKPPGSAVYRPIIASAPWTMCAGAGRANQRTQRSRPSPD